MRRQLAGSLLAAVQPIIFCAAGRGSLALFCLMGAEAVPCLQLGARRSEVRSGMTCHFHALSIDANDPPRLARFWAGVLGWDMADDRQDGIALLPSDDTGFLIRF